MAVAVLIDLSNYDSLLVQSSASRSGSPDGNVFFDTTGKIEYITKQELATLDLSGGLASSAVQIDIVAAARTFTRLTGDFVADGFKAGRSFVTSGFTTGANNLNVVIESVTATVITIVDGTGLVNETGSGDEVFTSIVEDNPLDETLGIKFEAIYAFENQERATDENLREFDRWTSGTFKFGGAYNYINSRKPSTDADRSIKRGSGWNEFASDGGTDRIYFGNKGLSNIEIASQPYYMLSSSATPDLNTLTPTDYAKAGQFDEAVQVFGDTGNVPTDATAGDFDTRAYEAVSIRTYGKNYDRKETIADLSIAELGGYFTGFAVNESDHLTTVPATYPLVDVYGGAQVAPFTSMTLEKLAVAQTETGFNEADGDFTWVLNNTADGSLDECIAFLDALAQTDDDIDTGAETDTKGKRVGTWYYYNATGQVVTRSGADSLGLFIEQIPTADEQNVVFTDDVGALKTRPFSVSIAANLGATAKADILAWYHAFFAALYNTAGAVTVLDSSASPIKGLASEADGSNVVSDAFDYDGDTVGGTAGTDKDCVYLCEGDGGATQAKTLFTITRQTTVAFTCAPSVENNV